MPSFEVLELSLFSRAFYLEGVFRMEFYEEDLSSFSFLCCFRFRSNGVPSLLLLFLFCLIGLANRNISLVCVTLVVTSIYRYCVHEIVYHFVSVNINRCIINK